MDIGSAVSRANGITEEELAAVADHRSSPLFTDAERLAMDLAVAMARTPVERDEDLMAALRRHFDEAQLVELVAAIAWENYRARFNIPFGVKPVGYSDGAFCV